MASSSSFRVTGGMAGRVARPGITAASRGSVWGRLGTGPWMLSPFQGRSMMTAPPPVSSTHPDGRIASGHGALRGQVTIPASVQGGAAPVSFSAQRFRSGGAFSLYRRPATRQDRLVTAGDGAGGHATSSHERIGSSCFPYRRAALEERLSVPASSQRGVLRRHISQAGRRMVERQLAGAVAAQDSVPPRDDFYSLREGAGSSSLSLLRRRPAQQDRLATSAKRGVTQHHASRTASPRQHAGPTGRQERQVDGQGSSPYRRAGSTGGHGSSPYRRAGIAGRDERQLAGQGPPLSQRMGPTGRDERQLAAGSPPVSLSGTAFSPYRQERLSVQRGVTERQVSTGAGGKAVKAKAFGRAAVSPYHRAGPSGGQERQLAAQGALHAAARLAAAYLGVVEVQTPPVSPADPRDSTGDSHYSSPYQCADPAGHQEHFGVQADSYGESPYQRQLAAQGASPDQRVSPMGGQERQLAAQGASSLAEVHFRDLDRPQEDAFSLELPIDSPLSQLLEAIAGRIGLGDPTRIRVRSGSIDGPLPEPFGYVARPSLGSLLTVPHQLQAPHVVYFQVLEVQTVQVLFHDKMDKISSYVTSMCGEFKAKEVLNALRTQVKLVDPQAEMRLVQVTGQPCSFKVFQPDETVKLADFAGQTALTLHAEEIPSDQEVLINFSLVMKCTDGSVRSIEDFILLLDRSEELSVEELKLCMEDEYPQYRDLIKKSRLFFTSPNSRLQLLDSDVISDDFRGVLSSAFEEVLLCEANELEADESTKRKRDEGEGSSVQKKTKAFLAPEPLEHEGGGSPAATTSSLHMSGPTNQDGEGSVGFGSPIHTSPAAYSSIPTENWKQGSWMWGTGDRKRGVETGDEEG